MNIETQRLVITKLDMSMAESIHLNSLDEDNRRFVPDEVFETVEDAAETIEFLMSCYSSGGPFVYPMLLKDGTNIGYVQAVPLDEGGWEVGYHVGKAYAGNGYATEAVAAFLPVIMETIGIESIWGICIAENIASRKVMEHTGFVKKYEGIGTYQNKQCAICKYIFELK